MELFKKIIYKNCKHKKYTESTFEECGNTYTLQICNKCKKGRCITKFKYIEPAIYEEWR